MIVFGSRMYFKKNVVQTFGVCPHCGKYAKLKSYDGRKFGHLYFIPLIPEGGPVRVLRECTKCSMGQHLPRPEADQVYGRIEALIPACVEAAAQGQHEFSHPETNETLHTGPFTADAIEMLILTGHAEDVPGLVGLFESEGAAYEAGIAEGVNADVSGRPDEALNAFRRARQAAPEEPYAAVQLADFARRDGRHEEQLACLRDANDLTGGEDPMLMLEMTGPLEALKRFDELVELLDTCSERVPQLQQDKKFQKLRKKYAKKAGKM